MPRRKGKYVKGSGEFGFQHWNLESEDKLYKMVQNAIGHMIREGIELATREYPCIAEFNTVGTVKIRVYLPLSGEDDFPEPAWEYSLADLVNHAIGFEEGDLKKLHAAFKRATTQLEQALLEHQHPR